MRKIKLYIAISLNGKIATADGNIDWLESYPNPDKIDYGFPEMIKSIDTTIQGYKTYEFVLSKGIENPSPGKKNYVITRKQHIQDTPAISFIKDNPIPFIKKLKEEEGKDIWLVGGGQINTMLLNEDLIDEMQIFVIPVIIPNGIELFESIPVEKAYSLVYSKSYSTGVVELKYQKKDT